MKKLLMLTVLLALVSVSAEASEKEEKEDFVVRIQPVTPPKPVVDEKDKEFEEQLESLKRQFKLLEYKLKIEKLKTEMEKLKAESLKLSSPFPLQVHSKPQATQEQSPVKEEVRYKEKVLQLRLQQQREKMEQLKLSYLQNLFTGVMEINGKKVAFDSFGRRYVVGSAVEGFVITKIDSDGITVASPYGGNYKIPIASGMVENKKKTVQFNVGGESEAVPPPESLPEQEPLPLE